MVEEGMVTRIVAQGSFLDMIEVVTDDDQVYYVDMTDRWVRALEGDHVSLTIAEDGSIEQVETLV